MGLAGHVFGAFVQARIAQRNGGIAVIQQLIDGFALLQPGQGAVLPQDGGSVGQCAFQPVVAAQQCPVAQFQTVFKDGPEFVHIPAGTEGHVHQIDGNHALVEPAIVFMLARLIIPGVGHVANARVCKTVGGQE